MTAKIDLRNGERGGGDEEEPALGVYTHSFREFISSSTISNRFNFYRPNKRGARRETKWENEAEKRRWADECTGGERERNGSRGEKRMEEKPRETRSRGERARRREESMPTHKKIVLK